MSKRFLIVLGILSIALLSGCNAGVYYQADADVALDPSEAITINGTLIVPGASASISKSKSAGVTKTLEGGTCIVMLVDGTELGTASVDADGSFSVLVDPAITSQDPYGVMLALCNPVIDGVPQIYPFSQIIPVGTLAAGGSIDTIVGIETSIAAQGVLNNAENTDERMTAASKYNPLGILHEMLLMFAETTREGGAEDSNQAAHKGVRDFLEYLFGQTGVGGTLTSSDVGALLRGESWIFEVVWPYLEGSPFSDMGGTRGVFEHDMFFRQILSGLILDPDTLETVKGDDVVRRAYAGFIGLINYGTALNLSNNMEQGIGNVRGMLAELTNAYKESGDESYIKPRPLAAQTALSAALQCSPEWLYGNLDALVIYIKAMHDGEIEPDPDNEGTREQWVDGMGNAVAAAMKVISEQTAVAKKEIYTTSASFTLRMCAANTGLCGVGDINETRLMQRVEAKIEADLAGGDSPFEGKEMCVTADDCPGGQTCSLGIGVCMTACSSGSCACGFPCVSDSQCGTNYCKKSAGNSTGSCTHCSANGDCSSGVCNSESHCAVPNQQQQQGSPGCVTFDTCIVGEFPDDRMRCVNNLCQECENNAQCGDEIGVGWTCVGVEPGRRCTPPGPPPPNLLGKWNRTTSVPSSVTGCPAQINANNLTIQGDSPNFSFAALNDFTINWNGQGQACSAKACGTCTNCATCSVGPNGIWNVLAFTNCDLPNPDIQDCDGSYTKAPPP